MVVGTAPVAGEVEDQRRERLFAERQAVERRRRRGNAEQGRALEALGHAVEYLIDSRLFLVGNRAADESRRAEQDAVQILMRMSRTVFLECPEVVSIWQQVDGFCRAFGRRRREDVQ